MTSRTNDPAGCLVRDMLSMLPGWLLLLGLDPLVATAAGIPLSAGLIVLRRSWWPGSRVAGRVVVALLVPLTALFLAAFAAFGSLGPVLGIALAAACLAAVELWNRRSNRSFVRRFPVATGVFFAVLATLLSAVTLERGCTPYPTEDMFKALLEAPAPPEWTARSKQQAVDAVRRALKMGGRNPDRVADATLEKLAGSAAELDAQPSPHGVHVTLYDRRGYHARGFDAAGKSTLEKVVRAALEASREEARRPRSSRRRQARWGARSNEVRVQIDVPGASRGTTDRPFFSLFAELIREGDSSLKKLHPLGQLLSLAMEIEPGVDGLEIALDGEPHRAVMLPADPVTFGWHTPRVRSAPAKLERMIRRGWRRDSGEWIDLTEKRATVRVFRTTCFGAPGPEAKVVDWFRGNTLIGPELSRELLVDRIILASDWLSRQVQRPDGNFHYEVFPPYRAETKDYNLPRHAGSIYGLFTIHHAAAREAALSRTAAAALAAGLDALDYVKSSLGSPDPEAMPDALCFLEKNGNATSGATALAAMAVAELPDPSAVGNPDLRSRVAAVPTERWLTGLGKCMLSMIDPDGAVFHNFRESRRHERVEKEPLYFPGEVMLALARTHARLGAPELLEGARRIGDRQERIYGVALALGWPYPGDHWIIQALSEVAQATDTRSYAELSVLMGRGYLREQLPPQEYLFPDYRGAYRRFVDLPRTTRAASRGEALGGAMDAAMFLGIDATPFEDALIEGARHLIEQQFVPANSYFIPTRYDVTGGIRMGLTDNHLRIDNNQHGLVALIRALEAMAHQGTN